MPVAIVRLIYFSEVRIEREQGLLIEQLNKILDASKRNNAANNISGALVFDTEWFVQALEGRLDDVWATYKRIGVDPRHANIRFVEMVTVPSRRFGNWCMGCGERAAKHDAVFAPYLYEGKFRPANMSGDMILSMMEDLSSCFFGPPSSPMPLSA